MRLSFFVMIIAMEIMVFILLSSWQSHANLWTKSVAGLSLGSYRVYIYHRNLLLLSSSADYHFIVVRRVGG